MIADYGIFDDGTRTVTDPWWSDGDLTLYIDEPYKPEQPEYDDEEPQLYPLPDPRILIADRHLRMLRCRSPPHDPRSHRPHNTRRQHMGFPQYVNEAEQIARLRTRLDLRNSTLSEIANQLDDWASESEKGGWSTHQVEPMRKLADKIRREIRL